MKIWIQVHSLVNILGTIDSSMPKHYHNIPKASTRHKARLRGIGATTAQRILILRVVNAYLSPVVFLK